MIELLPAPDHVLALRMAGTIPEPDIDRVTAEAAGKDFRYAFSKLGDWDRFPREAVFTDKQWARAFYRVADALAPQVELRTFAPTERDQAMAWASQVNLS